jgi:hypothetical protein
MRFQGGFSLVHTTLVVGSGGFRWVQEASGPVANGHDFTRAVAFQYFACQRARDATASDA